MAEEVVKLKAIILVETNKRTLQKSVVGESLGELRENFNKVVQDTAIEIGA